MTDSKVVLGSGVNIVIYLGLLTYLLNVASFTLRKSTDVSMIFSVSEPVILLVIAQILINHIFIKKYIDIKYLCWMEAVTIGVIAMFYKVYIAPGFAS